VLSGVREPWVRPKPCGRVGHLGWCIVQRVSAERGSPASAPAAPPVVRAGPLRIAPDQGLGEATAWDVGAIAPAGLTAHQLRSCPLTCGALLEVSRRSAVRQLLSWSAWLRFVCRRIRLR
jgi:hypothetical protein